MSSAVGPVIIGIVLVILGMQNRKGNIASLHRYHRHRVSEENRLPFGKLVGLGTMICGFALMGYGGFVYISERWQTEALVLVGAAILIAGLAVGLGLSFYAMIKYNKGIF